MVITKLSCTALAIDWVFLLFNLWPKLQKDWNDCQTLHPLCIGRWEFILLQGCALVAPSHLRWLTFGLGQLKKKSGRPSGRIDFSLCENPKRNQQTYRNGTERNKKKLHRAPRLLLAWKAKALKAQCNQ